MNYLLIENKGELDINSLILVGASTKRDDAGKIGMFGSGNKYAIATLIKNKIPFKIFSGEREVYITTKNIGFRGKSFEQIFIDGKETSLTTDMGPQWEPWMAVREFVSNSLDEGESNIVTSIDTQNSRAGYTRIFILHCEPTEKIINDWNRYFAFDRLDVKIENKHGRVLSNINTEDELYLYRKGIRCISATHLKSLFHYDIAEFNINESRVLSSGNGHYEVSKFICQYANADVAIKILNNASKRTADGLGAEKYYESQLYYDYFTLCQSWRDAIGNRTIVLDTLSGFFSDILQKEPCYVVPYALAKGIAKTFPDVKVLGGGDNGGEISYKYVTESDKMKFLIKEANFFLAETKYEVTYPISIVAFADDTLSLKGMGMILLSDKLFGLGKRHIVSEIIKINEQLKTNHDTRSEGIQNHFIGLYLTEKEERFCNYL